LGDHWLTHVLASIEPSWGIVATVVLFDLWMQHRSGQSRWLEGGVANSFRRLRRKGVPTAD
jgi:hypothetical protein